MIVVLQKAVKLEQEQLSMGGLEKGRGEKRTNTIKSTGETKDDRHCGDSYENKSKRKRREKE